MAELVDIRPEFLDFSVAVDANLTSSKFSDMRPETFEFSDAVDAMEVSSEFTVEVEFLDASEADVEFTSRLAMRLSSC